MRGSTHGMTDIAVATLDRPAWQADARCNTGDQLLLGVMIPDATTASLYRRRPSAIQAFDQAKAICARCPVVAECLEFALEHDPLDGVWGGTDPVERIQIRRRLDRRPPPVREHGTGRGFMQHKRADEAPCAACDDAWQEICRRRY